MQTLANQLCKNLLKLQWKNSSALAALGQVDVCSQSLHGLVLHCNLLEQTPEHTLAIKLVQNRKNKT